MLPQAHSNCLRGAGPSPERCIDRPVNGDSVLRVPGSPSRHPAFAGGSETELDLREQMLARQTLSLSFGRHTWSLKDRYARQAWHPEQARPRLSFQIEWKSARLSVGFPETN